MNWTHDALAADLLDARHAAGELAAERLRVGPGYTATAAQFDVVGVRPSWTDPRITGYEVKVSRSDFLSDLRSDKWRKYLPLVQRLYFAVPARLVEVQEVPSECGLLYRHESMWRAARLAPKREITDGARSEFLMSLLLRLKGAPWDGPATMHLEVMMRAGRNPRNLAPIIGAAKREA